jgi:hypothetical protein
MIHAYAGRLRKIIGQLPNTNKRQEYTMDNMTLTSKEEVRKTIIELISIVNAVDERDDAIVARARLLLQNLQ